MKHSKVPACDFTAMDMTSTILNAMGVEFTSEFQGEKNHIGLTIQASFPKRKISSAASAMTA